MFKVKATKLGFYGGLRRREGDEFTVADKSELGSWMEVLEEEKPKPKRRTRKKAPDKVGENLEDGGE